MDCRGCRPLYQVLCRRSFLWIAEAAGHCIMSFVAVVFYGLQRLQATVSGPCRRSFLWIAGVAGHCIRSFAAAAFYGLQGLTATVSSPLPPQVSMDCRGCRPLYQDFCDHSFLWIAGVAGQCIRAFAAVVFYELQGLSASVSSPLPP